MSVGQREITKIYVVKTQVAKVKRKIDNLEVYEPTRRECESLLFQTGQDALNVVKQDRSKSSKQMANEWKNFGF